MLDAAANSVVCTEPTDMLSALFGVTPNSVRPMTFITDRCKNVRSRCDQCLERHQCRMSGKLISRLQDELARRAGSSS